jgi:hypothetical protein
MNDIMETGFDKIHLFEKMVLKKVFSSTRLKQSTIFGSPDIEPRSFDGHLSTNNLFSSTNYEYTGDGLFVHFTTLSALSLIIKNGFLRMSEFNCLSDKTELLFASEIFGVDFIRHINNLEEERSNMFCLSACKSTADTMNNQYMWDNYASHGRGCAIEYKFSQMDIFNMFLGEIQYGKRKLGSLMKIKTLAETFQNEFNFTVSKLPLFLLKVLAFHKDIKFKQENEVRLMFHRDGSIGNNSPHISEYRDFYTDNSVRNFIKLHLLGSNPHLPHPQLDEETVLRLSPQIEISRIIIGPNNHDLLETIHQLSILRKQNNLNFEIWNRNTKGDLKKIN